jgi:AmmeMemoRadiSam system protein A
MWPPLPNSADTSLAPQVPGANASPEYSPEERSELLRIAHEAVAAAVHSESYTPETSSLHLAESRGVFTTLYHKDGQLRGCIGYVAAAVPLFRAVAETAQAAALEDPRFNPVEPAELTDIHVSLSILSPPFEIRPEQIEVGRHGLIISQHGRRGLLLPQVATEHGWDARTFLAETCRKAHLAADAWQHGAEIEAFTAEVFADLGTPE